MTQMVETELENYPIQYTGLVDRLNKLYALKRLNNAKLDTIGTIVSPRGEHKIYEETADNYTWLGSLKFSVMKADVKVLFPWHQNFDNSESPLDRSINVYSTEKIPDDDVSDLLKKIADKMEDF